MSKKNNNKDNYYVDPEEFYEEMKEYIYSIREAKKNNKPQPRISDSIGEKIVLIATGLGYRWNFINYPFRDDMIGDAIELCIRYIHNFNPEKYKNPYSYFNMICWQTFVQRIKKEKKLFKKKLKYIHNLSVDSIFSDVQEHDENEAFDNEYIQFLQECYLSDLADDDLVTQEKTKSKNKNAASLEDFMNEED